MSDRRFEFLQVVTDYADAKVRQYAALNGKPDDIPAAEQYLFDAANRVIDLTDRLFPPKGPNA